MALPDQPYFPFYVKDWMTNLKLLSVSAQAHGVMINIMCLMHKSPVYGKILLKQKFKQNESTPLNFAWQLAKVLPFDREEVFDGLSELLEESALKIVDDELVCDRMVRDADLSLKRANAGSKGGKSTQESVKKFAKAKPQAKAKQNTVNANAYVNEDEYVSDNVDVIKEGKKPKIESKSLHTDLRLEFESKYEELTEMSYSWSAKDAASLKTMIKKLKTLNVQAGRGGSDDDIRQAWQYILTHIPDWYKSSGFSISVWNSKFNEFTNEIKNSKNEKQNSKGWAAPTIDDVIQYQRDKHGLDI